MSQSRIGLQATLNGPLTKEMHVAVPVSVEELARDAAACVAAGARAIHLHPRDSEGHERLDGEATWLLLTDAVRRGIDTRIGLEDTVYEPNGERTSGNEALVRAACRLGACIIP